MVRLNRTAADTFVYYARTRTSKVLASVAIAGVLTGAGVWQFPNAVSTVEGWAAGLSGRDELLSAQSEVNDALNAAGRVVEGAADGSVVDLSELTGLIAECEEARDGGDAPGMLACAGTLSAASDVASAQLDREKTAIQVVALEQQAAEAQRQREAEAAAAQAAAEEAARQAAELAAAQAAAEEAARRAAEEARKAAQAQQNPNPGSGGGGGGNQSGGGGGGTSPSQGSRLSTTVTCNSKQTVTASASGGGTVTVTITGAGSGSNTGQGSATASATGSGIFTITATSTGGGLSLNPSWTGACW